MTDKVVQLDNGWSLKVVDQLQQQRNEAMDLMDQALELMSQAIKKAPSLSFESVLTNNYWYTTGQFEQLKESLAAAIDQRCLEVLSEMHPNEQQLAAYKKRRASKVQPQVVEPPLKVDARQRDLVLALRYFEELTAGSGAFTVGRYLRASNCIEHGDWADYSSAPERLTQLWEALMVFDRLNWIDGKPSRGAARFMEPAGLITEGLRHNQLVYDFLVFKVRVVGQDILIDFNERQDLLARINTEISDYFGASAN